MIRRARLVMNLSRGIFACENTNCPASLHGQLSFAVLIIPRSTSLRPSESSQIFWIKNQNIFVKYSKKHCYSLFKKNQMWSVCFDELMWMYVIACFFPSAGLKIPKITQRSVNPLIFGVSEILHFVICFIWVHCHLNCYSFELTIFILAFFFSILLQENTLLNSSYKKMKIRWNWLEHTWTTGMVNMKTLKQWCVIKFLPLSSLREASQLFWKTTYQNFLWFQWIPFYFTKSDQNKVHSWTKNIYFPLSKFPNQNLKKDLYFFWKMNTNESFSSWNFSIFSLKKVQVTHISLQISMKVAFYPTPSHLSDHCLTTAQW